MMHLCAAVIVFLFFSEAATGSKTVTVELNVATHQGSERECIGGSTGLTNTSIVVHYRLLEDGHSLAEWMFLAQIRFSGGSLLSQSIAVPDNGSAQVGVQFRLLQLEHGGEGCNCWDVERFSVALHALNSSTVSLAAITNINKFECFSHGQLNSGRQTFCYGNGNEARGVISKALYFSDERAGVECPGNSGSLLISPKGPAVPENCDSAASNVRM